MGALIAWDRIPMFIVVNDRIYLFYSAFSIRTDRIFLFYPAFGTTINNIACKINNSNKSILFYKNQIKL